MFINTAKTYLHKHNKMNKRQETATNCFLLKALRMAEDVTAL